MSWNFGGLNVTFAKSKCFFMYSTPVFHGEHPNTLNNYLQLQNPKPEPLTRIIFRTQPTMLRDYFCCCCKSRSTEPNDDVADRDPVLLVSGIAGSILNSKRKKSGFETRVWVRILLADLEFKKKLWSIYNPETGSFFFFFPEIFFWTSYLLCLLRKKRFSTFFFRCIFCRVYRATGW